MAKDQGDHRYFHEKGGAKMKSIQAHVDALFREIPDSPRKESLKQEIVQNLNEKVGDLMAQGKSEEDAINRAIVEFGDIGDIREELRAQQQAPLMKTKSGLQLCYSIEGSALIIALMLFINLYAAPDFLWCVFPIFAVLWWPLTMYFRWRKYR
jgi:uncharacterized protein YoaH (UPF0181 family)